MPNVSRCEWNAGQIGTTAAEALSLVFVLAGLKSAECLQM